MNGILSNNKSDNKLQGVLFHKPESVETAGSLAMNVFYSLFDNNSYDEFSTNNPFAVDYSLYQDCGETVAYNGFLESFSNAVSTLNSSECSCVSTSSDCGCSSCFSSVC